MQLTHAMFGIGGLIGPFFVYLFETRTYIIMSILLFAVSFVFCKLQTPDDPTFKSRSHEQEEELLSKS